jgi:hypothetical protein
VTFVHPLRCRLTNGKEVAPKAKRHRLSLSHPVYLTLLFMICSGCNRDAQVTASRVSVRPPVSPGSLGPPIPVGRSSLSPNQTPVAEGAMANPTAEPSLPSRDQSSTDYQPSPPPPEQHALNESELADQRRILADIAAQLFREHDHICRIDIRLRDQEDFDTWVSNVAQLRSVVELALTDDNALRSVAAYIARIQTLSRLIQSRGEGPNQRIENVRHYNASITAVPPRVWPRPGQTLGGSNCPAPSLPPSALSPPASPGPRISPR